MVMELIEGPTLADRLATGPLPLDLALEIARQIAEALEAAHEKGIVHRDPVRGVYLGTLESSDVTRLLASDTQAEYVAPGWLVFVRQGTLLAQRFDVSRRTLGGDPMTVADAVSFDPISGLVHFPHPTAA